MAVTVSSDLSVSVSEDNNVKKLTEKQELLKDSIQKGEPKIMGISQVMLGLLVITYSIPLLSSELTEVIRYGVPWWSGLSFVIAGAFALVMEKYNNIQTVLKCLVITALAIFFSVIALVIYILDLFRNQEKTCPFDSEGFMMTFCEDLHYGTMFSREMKSFLTCLNVVQMAISSAFFFLLYNERRRFINYTLVN